jgi:hypothetical protein
MECQLKIADIQNIGAEILKLLDAYHNPPHRELMVDAVLFAYLSGRFTNIARQHYVYLYGSTRPHRIDFRFGGSNPVVLELAVRPPKGGGNLLGAQNTSELRKLCRVSHTAARLRVLLLLDLASEPLLKESLKDTYDPLHAGPGKFKRSVVRVIYVHRRNRFNFAWSPFK